MQKCIFIFLSFIIISCSNNNDLGDTREFEFIYKVNLDKTNQKVEVWIPIPQTNEVQTISNIKFDTSGLEYEIKDENKHGNKYVTLGDIFVKDMGMNGCFQNFEFIKHSMHCLHHISAPCKKIKIEVSIPTTYSY